MAEPNNEARITRAEIIIEQYRADHEQGDEDLQTTINDVFTDMRHWAAACESVSFDTAIRLSEINYDEEKERAN